MASSDKRPVKVPATWAIVAAALLALFYFVSSLYIAAHRVFWFDELFTIHIARVPKLTTIWTALANGVDALPPTYYALVRVFDSLFGPNDIAARVPSAIALAVGLLVIFDCARRLTDRVHALIALCAAPCSFLPYYGFEARSYALYFLFAALALWVWSYRGLSVRTQAVLFGACFFLGECFHYYFVMCLAPYFAWELLRWKPGRRPSAKLVAGIVGCVLPALLFSPLILSFSRKFAGGYWNRPTLRELQIIYSQLFPDALLLLAVMMVWFALVRADKAEPEDVVLPAMLPVEAIGWLFLAVPLAAYVVAVLKTNAFYSRYFIGLIPGVSVAFACLLWRHFRHNLSASLGALLLLAGWGAGLELRTMLHPEKVEATGIRAFLQVESLLRIEGKHYLVFSEPLLFLEAQQYSTHPEQVVLLLPSDFSRQPTQGPDPYLHQRLELNLSPYYPLQVWTLDDLRRHQADAALVEPDEQALRDVQRNDMHAQTRMGAPLKVDYLQ